MAKDNWMQRNFSKRKLIKKNENKISYVQIIGFIMVAMGIVYMTIYRMITDTSAEGMAISFFVIMLGMSFAFPSLLEGRDKEVSTMRIVVFMMVNVICLLLIKIGWAADIHSLGQIGLDQYWMGVIAFIFGAKATQSYFESKLAAPPPPKDQDNNSPSDSNSVVLSGYQNAQLAIDANPDIKARHSNIVKIIPSYCMDGEARISCVDICISDNNKKGIPSFLSYKLADGSIAQIKTRVISNFGNAKPHIGRGDFIANDNSRLFLGTVCCILDVHQSDELYLLTCNHVMTGGDFADPGTVGDKAVELLFNQNFVDVGTWQYGKMDDKVDAAIVRIENTDRVFSNDIHRDIYNVSEKDCSVTKIELVGAFTGTTRAYIIHINQPIPIDYSNKTVEVHDLITLSITRNDSNFTPPTQEGDSGALVYHAETRQPIGMVVGANSHFTFVIPMKTIFKAFPDLKCKIHNN
ncbi:MAG: hypothetical protein ABI480_06090 [Chitinophagaceae bacterium]